MFASRLARSRNEGVSGSNPLVGFPGFQAFCISALGVRIDWRAHSARTRVMRGPDRGLRACSHGWVVVLEEPGVKARRWSPCGPPGEATSSMV